MKKAVVTGSTSMLGKHLILELLKHGVQVFTAGRNQTDDIKVNYEQGVIENSKKIENIDVIFHCAASFEDDSIDGARTNYFVNTIGCYSILEMAENFGCNHIVNSGSAFSYENSDGAGYTSYGLSKAHGEQVLQWGMKKKSGIFTSLRFSQFYDTEGLCCKHQPWFGRVIAYASRGKDLNMPKSSGIRNYIHIEDAAKILILAAENKINNIIPVSHPESYTMKQIAELAYSIFNKGGNVIEDPNKTPFRKFVFKPSDKALSDYEFITLKQGIHNIKKLNFDRKFGPMDVI